MEENRSQQPATTAKKSASPPRQVLGDVTSANWPNRQASYARAVDQTRSKSNSSNSTNVADRYRNPYYTGAYLSEEKKARLEKFSTEKTQVNIPAVKGGSGQQQKPVDIDFSAYDEPSMSLQQGTRAKVVRYF